MTGQGALAHSTPPSTPSPASPLRSVPCPPSLVAATDPPHDDSRSSSTAPTALHIRLFTRLSAPLRPLVKIDASFPRLTTSTQTGGQGAPSTNRNENRKQKEDHHNMSERSKNAKAAAVTKLITGAKKLFTNGAQLVPLDGKSMTVDNATAELQTFVDNRAATVDAQATAKTRVAAENAQAPALLALIGAFE